MVDRTTRRPEVAPLSSPTSAGVARAFICAWVACTTGLPQSHIPSDLRTADYVFIPHDGHRGPPQPPYDGPFRVLETGDKTFAINIGGKPDHISTSIWTAPYCWFRPRSCC
ncbi:hypothetical protein AAFF_G00310740 [Aldrovandia affinis]|uniref:Uncharacterized protein n=1 Tax=Aldrovandia affinis TaxID=143900 RepID=A0AAD7RA96_9TELE|nr:hypothetical protein AAFF_G00310740 [Aldrovandia affinis]